MSDVLKLTGMVLLAAPVGEYDKRIVLLTRERGKVTAFAKGARRQNSPLLAALNPFAFGEFSCFEGRSSYRLVQAEIQQYFREISADYEAAMYGFYFLELADYYSQEGNDESELLKLLYAALRALIRGQQPKKLVRYIYELRVMVLNGEYPEAFACAGCGKKEELTRFSLGRNGFLCENCAPGEGRKVTASTVYAFQYIISAPVAKLFAFTVSGEVLNEIQWIMDRFRKKWIDHTFHSLEILDFAPNL